MSIFKKNVIAHDKFYIASFINEKNKNSPYLIFVHGGPGLNCGVVEFLIENQNLFELLECNIVLYDQRGCGRSARYFDSDEPVLHSDNIADLGEIYEHLTKHIKLKIKGFVGHSYGAKLLYDFFKTSKCDLPGIFISTADSILTPRLNNLMFDLAYLKKKDMEKYRQAIERLAGRDLNMLWDLTEELSPYFQENQDRKYLYWANMDLLKQVEEIQRGINFPINHKVFMSVRKDLYSKIENCSVDIDKLNIPYLWINGFQDSVIGEPMNGLFKKNGVTLFSKSSHYPHIEENDKFCEIANAFIKIS